MPSFQTTVKTEVDVDIDFEVFCARCGAGLCNQSDTRSSHNRNYPQVTVEPCDKCIETAKDEGYDKGYEKGYESGLKDGAAEALEEAEQRLKPHIETVGA